MEKIQKTLVMVTLLFLTVAINTVIAKNGSNTQNDHWRAPVTAKDLQNPLQNNQKAAEVGEAIFKQQCATCHGTSGKGDGPAGKYLGKKLPDFTSASFSEQTDGEIFWKISNGNAPMPAFKAMLSEDQRWQVLNYIRTFASH